MELRPAFDNLPAIDSAPLEHTGAEVDNNARRLEECIGKVRPPENWAPFATECHAQALRVIADKLWYFRENGKDRLEPGMNFVLCTTDLPGKGDNGLTRSFQPKSEDRRQQLLDGQGASVNIVTGIAGDRAGKSLIKELDTTGLITFDPFLGQEDTLIEGFYREDIGDIIAISANGTEWYLGTRTYFPVEEDTDSQALPVGLEATRVEVIVTTRDQQ